MADKKYPDFPAGTYDTEKIFLQADPSTGALEKVNLPTQGGLFGDTDNLSFANRAFHNAGFSFILDNDPDNSNYPFINMSSIGLSDTLDLYGSDEDGYVAQLTLNASGWDMEADTADGGASFLFVSGALTLQNGATGGELQMSADGNVKLQSSGKLNLLADLINIPNIQDFASNALAVAAGLSVGDLYKNADFLCIVHS